MIRQGSVSDSTAIGSPSGPDSYSRPPRSPNSRAEVHPPSPPSRSQRRSTLFQMMSDEQSHEPARRHFQSTVSKIMGEFGCLKSSNALVSGRGDVRVTMVGKEVLKRVSIDVHKKVLLEKSGFFRERLKTGERDNGLMHTVLISECDDVEVYLEALVLLYCENLRRRLTGVDVSKILDLLKVFAAIMFENGVVSCLEYLEGVPWTDEEEEKILHLLEDLHLREKAATVLERVGTKKPPSNWADEVFLKLWSSILLAKDPKPRKEMKDMITRLFTHHELDVSKDALYTLCHRCVSSLVLSLSEATSVSNGERGTAMAVIARETENLQWVVEMLIAKKYCEEFVGLWGEQEELAELHAKMPIMYRHEISKITAQICVAIGRGQILVRRETRSRLLSTWLEPFYDDFDWILRSSRFVDRKLVEDGVGQTILTLPLPQQQTIFLDWFDRFLGKGDDCPNIHKAFEVWWRRAFLLPSHHRLHLGREHS